MSNCPHRDNTKVSRILLRDLSYREVLNAAVLFLKSKEPGGIYMEGN
jgi:hypothetical protein